MTRVTIFGATGRSGSAILTELAPDCEIVAAVRKSGDEARLPQVGGHIRVEPVEIDDPASIAAAIEGSTILINAVRLRGDIDEGAVLDFHQRIMATVADLGQERSTHVVIVGGAGTLRLSDGSRFWQSPSFPAVTLPRGRAHALLRDHLEGREHAYGWTYLVPPPRFDPEGPRTGDIARWPAQRDETAFLRSSISYADFALAARQAALTPWQGVWLVGEDTDSTTA